VRILAAHLGIPLANVHAVALLFDDDGGYRDFDRSSPLWRNRGKVEVLAALPAEQRPVLYVGDGVTDLESVGTADLFVGFGGVAVRDAVVAGAEAWVEGPGLAAVLEIGLDVEEKRQLESEPRFAGLIR
jgi:phosphoserine phosphatase